MQRVGSALCEVWAKAVAANVFHLVLIWERRNCTCWVFSIQSLVEEDEVCKASTDCGCWLLEGGKGSLMLLVAVERTTRGTDVCGNQI